MFNDMITDHKLDVLCLTETWLKPDEYIILNESTPCYIQPVPGYVTEREDHADYLILKKIYLLKIKNEQHKVNKVSINV